MATTSNASLRALVAQQRAQLATAESSLTSYHGRGKNARPWDGFWTVTPQFPSISAAPAAAAANSASSAPREATAVVTTSTDLARAKTQHALRWPQYSVLYLKQGEGDRANEVTGTWVDGDGQRYLLAGSLQPSTRSIEGATLRHSGTGAFLTPVALRAGYTFEALHARFEWTFGSPVPTPDSAVLTRHEFPRIVLVSSSEGDGSGCATTSSPNGDTVQDQGRSVDAGSDVASGGVRGNDQHVRLARRMASQQPLQFVMAPVVATSARAAAWYGAVSALHVPDAHDGKGDSDEASGSRYTPMRHDELEGLIEQGLALTFRRGPPGEAHIAAVLAAPVFTILRGTGKTVLVPATVEDVTRARAWRVPAALAYVDFATTVSSPSHALQASTHSEHSSPHRLLASSTASSPLLLRSRSQISVADRNGGAAVGKRTVGGFTCLEYKCPLPPPPPTVDDDAQQHQQQQLQQIDDAAKALSAASRPLTFGSSS